MVFANLSASYHLAEKKIPFFDVKTGVFTEKVNIPNGFKLEMFIFDVFPLAKKWIVLETDRCVMLFSLQSYITKSASIIIYDVIE